MRCSQPRTAAPVDRYVSEISCRVDEWYTNLVSGSMGTPITYHLHKIAPDQLTTYGPHNKPLEFMDLQEGLL